jgi:hypothetical protein
VVPDVCGPPAGHRLDDAAAVSDDEIGVQYPTLGVLDRVARATNRYELVLELAADSLEKFKPRAA